MENEKITLATICRKEGKFNLNSGIESNVKWDIEELFKYRHDNRIRVLKPFFRSIRTYISSDISVIGIPTGGDLLASDFETYLGGTQVGDGVILFDDVLTTGNTVKNFLKNLSNVYLIAILINRSRLTEIEGIPIISYLTCDIVKGEE